MGVEGGGCAQAAVGRGVGCGGHSLRLGEQAGCLVRAVQSGLVIWVCCGSAALHMHTRLFNPIPGLQENMKRITTPPRLR